MKMLKFIKAHAGVITAVVLAVVLICSLIVATAILAKPEASQSVGVIDSATLDEGFMQYTQKTDNYFKTAFKNYYNRLFANLFKDLQITVKASDVINPEALSSAILKGFKNGKVSADKVLAFADYLDASEPDDVVEGIIIAYLVPAKDEGGNIITDETTGEILYEFSDTADAEKLASLNLSPSAIVKDILENTTITTEDLSNIAYYVLLNSSEGEYKSVLTELGENGFRAMFADSVTIYELISNVGEGVTLSSIRKARELMYATGVTYNEILEKIGLRGIETLTNGMTGIVLDSSISGYSDAFETAMKGASELAPTLFSFLGSVLTEVPADIPLALDKMVNDGREEAKAYVGVRCAELLLSGLEVSYSFTKLDEEALISSYAKVLGALDYINMQSLESAPQGVTLESQIVDYSTSIRDSLSTIKQIASYKDALPKEYEVGSLTNSQIAEITGLIDSLEMDRTALENGINKVASVAFYNILITIFVNSYEV